MTQEDKLKSLFVDMDSRARPIQSDDFLVAIGKKQSNTVYHVFSSTLKPSKYPGATRYQVKVYKSDLITLLKREKSQVLHPFQW